MLGILSGQIEGRFFVELFIGILLIGYFVYKEWPEFKKRMNGNSITKEADHETRIKALEDTVAITTTKLDQVISKDVIRDREISDSKKERAIQMRALLAITKALQELGANGPTKIHDSQEEIEEYLLDHAHD